MKLKISGLQLRVCLRIGASGDDVVRNALAGFLASGFAGRGWLQAYVLHLRGPFPVMVRTARGCAVGLLPDMRHFMGKRRKYFLVGAPGEAVRVHRQFMRGGRCSTAPGETLRREIASGLGVALQRHQHMGQGPGEQFRVEEVVRLLKRPVLGGGDRFACGGGLFQCAGSLECGSELYRTIQTDLLQSVLEKKGAKCA